MKTILALFVMIAILFGLSACEPSKGFEKGKIEATVFVVSDTHLLSEDLFSEGNVKYVKEHLTADGRVQECDYQLMEALVEEVNQEKPDALIFTGDLSFNGEKTSHEAFISFLEKIDKDVQILVIPGNHDFNIDDCRSYFDDSPHGENTVSGPEFCEMYADYGYGDAMNRDSESYSYIYEINEKLWAVMLDTSLCEYNEGAGLNNAGGAVWDETIEWLRPYLEEAKEKGISVIGFSHHNLLVHNERFINNYVMYNSEALEALYKEYGVKLHLSGHMHIQHIASKKGIDDIAQGGFLDYGNRISRLDVYDNCLEYSRIQIGDMSDYSIGVFCDKYMSRNVSRYEELYKDKAEEVHLLASLLNAYYFDGDYQRIHETLSQRSEAVNLLKKNEKDSYMGTVLSVENKDQNYLLIKK